MVVESAGDGGGGGGVDSLGWHGGCWSSLPASWKWSQRIVVITTWSIMGGTIIITNPTSTTSLHDHLIRIPSNIKCWSDGGSYNSTVPNKGAPVPAAFIGLCGKGIIREIPLVDRRGCIA